MQIRYLILYLFCYFLVSCQDDSSGPEITSGRTVIVYLGVDNNFKGEEKEKIEALTKGWKSSFQGNLLVYADAGGKPFLTRIYTKKGKSVAEVVKSYEDSNSADPEVFNRVLRGIISDYPADSYGLVVLSHATGWLPVKTLGSARSVISDRGSEMEIRDFAEALPEKMDFIIFDACFMGAVEVVYELKDKADYIVGSPAEVLVPGFVYTSMMTHLMAPVPDVTAVAREFYEYYDAQSSFARSATVSVVKTAELEGLAALCRELLHDVDGESAVDIRTLQNYGYGPDLLYFDMGDYIKALSPERYDEFMQKLDKCLLYEAHTPGYYSAGNYAYNPIRTYSGLAVYIPQKAYPFMNGEYRKLKWAQRVL